MKIITSIQGGSVHKHDDDDGDVDDDDVDVDSGKHSCDENGYDDVMQAKTKRILCANITMDVTHTNTEETWRQCR